MKVTTKFDLLQSVHIKALGVNGKIISIFLGADYGLQYNIRYFGGGDSKTCYFFEEELDLAKPEDKGIPFFSPSKTESSSK